jgi:retron-type reverse transcriptase
VQEAVRQVLEPLWEPTFHPSSHGFRPEWSCHTAIAEAEQHLEDGHGWVVDLDLEKFFDRVCHQRLTAKLAERVSDRRLLVLIGRMLKAKVVLLDGVVIDTEEGVRRAGRFHRWCPTSCWTSSTVSSPGVATGSFAMQTTPRCTCVANGRGSG